MDLWLCCIGGPWGKAIADGRRGPLLSRDRLGLAEPRDPDDDVGLRPWPTAPPRFAMLLLLYICSGDDDWSVSREVPFKRTTVHQTALEPNSISC